MKDNILFQEENGTVSERYELALERIKMMEQEDTVKAPFVDYFRKVASFINLVSNVYHMVEEGSINSLSLKDLQAMNRALYDDITGDNYFVSYANPTYACNLLGDKFGKLFAFLYTELRSIIVYAFEGRRYELTIYLELFIEIYNYMEWEDEFTYKDCKRAIYEFMNDYCEVHITGRVRELICPELSFATDIIMESDLSDLRYLYQFGDYITENELETARFINSLPEEEVKAMAYTFTEGYRLGFIANRLDLSHKATVNIRYQLGFEKMVRYAILYFKELGLKPTIYRAAYQTANKYQHLKVGYHATSPNKQYDYDHRYDIGIFFDKAYMQKKLECMKVALEQYKDIAGLYAGPALIEVFGEELFAPEDKKEVVKLDKRQQKLYVDYYNQENLIKKEYLKTSETSFTIISYPVPEIGKDFKDIFLQTVKVNTLESSLYQRIQKCLIDALDQGEFVHVLGKGKNHTDMWVKLYLLNDSTKETIFENCVADVNIPVGEVFTSPVLKGTNGILHVPKIYLHDLEYRELELTFQDGVITDYTCKNFKEETKNKNFIKENLLYNHDTLPLGEFAIGTNTTAYMMGKRFDIAPRLPILIAEKTGPHFAIGDTCYKMSEETPVYNPDGKEIVARENEISALRKSDPGKAYFNCHTDITLPFDEIREIAVIHKDKTSTLIMNDSRFVLEGTLELNTAFDMD